MARAARTCCILLFLGACGGEPIGSHVPRPNPSAVAVGAAAAATAITLADPNAKPPKPEDDTGRSLRGKKGTGETVPADVLDRADQKRGEPEPCEPAAPDGDEKKGPELFPADDDGGRVRTPKLRPCEDGEAPPPAKK